MWACVGALLCASPASAGAPVTGEIIIVLEKGVGRGAGSSDLTLTAECSDGRVKDLWGNASRYNTSVHDGIVRESKVTADGIEFIADILINRDQFVLGGWASYTVRVARADVPVRPGTGEKGYVRSPHPDLTTGLATGALEGTFSGTFQGPGDPLAFSGRAVGIVLPLVRPKASFVPPAEDEHPRLLVRKSDVPALKARLKTPLGQALLTKLHQAKGIVPKAMFCLLTDEKSAADEAFTIAQDFLSQEGMAGNEIFKTLVWGGRVTRIALLYDLAYKRLAPGARQQLEAYLRRFGSRTMYKPWHYCDPHSHMMLGHGAPHVMGIYPGGGMASLAMYGTRGPEPKKPKLLEIPKAPDPPPPFMSKKQLERIGEEAVRRTKVNAKTTRTWEYNCALWKETGGLDVALFRLLKHSHAHMSVNIRRAIGEGGFKGSGEGHVHMWYPLVGQYAIAHRNVLGEPVTGRPDIGHFVLRYIATTIFGDRRAVNQGFGGGGGTAGLHYTSQAMALCPPEYRPVVLWYWLKLLGVSPEDVGTVEGAEKIAERSARAGAGASQVSGLALLNTLAYFPIDPETGKLSMAPRNPAEVMPRAWETKTHGLYCFRSRWQDKDDIVAKILAQQAGYRGWGLPDSADIQIYGLGHAWFQKGSTGTRTFRVMGNVVILPEEQTSEGGHGVVTHFQHENTTGSGTVTIDLNKVYEGRKVIEVKNEDGTPKIVTATGLPATRSVPADTGIRGLRAFAADYSGKAGVPALFVIVDKITGGKKKEWVYHIPKDDPRSREVRKLSMDENGFTVAAQDNTSMKATFAAPRELKLERVTGTHNVGTAKAGRLVHATLNALTASGADPKSGEFFVILTLQEGEAPPVKVEGSGLDAKVTVGGQTIAFDGEKIVFGE